jgi:Ser/Thr protein kinase RdoA (MazF antagonist)
MIPYTAVMTPQRSNLRRWWSDDPEDPDRPARTNFGVQRLLARIAPGETAIDMGGNFTLNMDLPRSNRVVRVHRPWNTSRRIRGEQRLRRALIDAGWSTPRPLSFAGRDVLRCGSRLAEVETYLPGHQPSASVASYRRLYHEMGRLHRDLAVLDVDLPLGMAANWAPPGSLRRWLAVTVPALSITPEGAGAAARLEDVVRHVRRRWIPPGRLPQQLIHGDFRLGNVVHGEDGQTVVYDFGFANVRPRVHDLAYTAAFMMLSLDIPQDGQEIVEIVVESYERARRDSLQPQERAWLPVDAAAVMVYTLAHAGYVADPQSMLPLFLPFLDVAEWFLATWPGPA